MRLLEYRLDLTNNGYTVIGGDMHYEALIESECQPIKIIGMGSGSPTSYVENLVHAVDKDWDEEEEKTDFYANYADILRGKYLEWQIISFRVVVGYVCLNFYNFKTKENGYLLLNNKLIHHLDMQFSVPSIDGDYDTKYLVSLSYFNSGRQRTQVTEYAGHIKREMDFFFKKPNETNPFSDEQYLEITEYANL